MIITSFWTKRILLLTFIASNTNVLAWNLSVGRRQRAGKTAFPLTSGLTLHQSFNKKQASTALFSSSSGGSSSDGNNIKKNLSASERERREEEQRRRQRQNDVVVGKTSALRDAQDYALNPQATEQEWLRQASRDEQMVYKWTEKGLEYLKMLKLEDADAAFNEVFKIKPDAYLWQAGIAKFYLGDIVGAADVFARNAALFEKKFGGPASEERIWRQACALKLIHTKLEKREKKENRADLVGQLTPIPELKEDPDSLFAETRKVIRIAGDLFNASINNDQCGVILARAKLRSLGGNFDDIPRFDIKLWKLNAWFYLGLHYDSIGEIEESKECMKMALRNCPNMGNGENIIHILPLMHMSRRDWFDDDDLDADPLKLLRASSPETNDADDSDFAKSTSRGILLKQADPLVLDSIRKSIAKMKLFELQDALRVRGLKVVGSKLELQKRLFQSLMDDAGLSF